jgi:hypothetical protein
MIDAGPGEVESHADPQFTRSLSTITEDLDDQQVSIEPDPESALIPVPKTHPGTFGLNNNTQDRVVIGSSKQTPQGIQTGFSVPIQQPAMMVKTYKSIYTDLQAPLQQLAMIVESTQTDQATQMDSQAPIQQAIMIRVATQTQQATMIEVATQTQPQGNSGDGKWIMILEETNDELRKRNQQLEKENLYLTEKLKEATSTL